MCSVSFIGVWDWALSGFSAVGGELRLVKMESHNSMAWKPLSSRGTTVGDVLGRRRGHLGAWHLGGAYACLSSQNGHLACVGPVGLLRAPELEGHAFFHVPTCTRAGGPGPGVPSCSRVSGLSTLSTVPRSGREKQDSLYILFNTSVVSSEDTKSFVP